MCVTLIGLEMHDREEDARPRKRQKTEQQISSELPDLPQLTLANLLLSLPSLLLHPPTHTNHERSLALSYCALEKCNAMTSLDRVVECRAATGLAELGLQIGLSSPGIQDEIQKAITKAVSNVYSLGICVAEIPGLCFIGSLLSHRMYVGACFFCLHSLLVSLCSSHSSPRFISIDIAFSNSPLNSPLLLETQKLLKTISSVYSQPLLQMTHRIYSTPPISPSSLASVLKLQTKQRIPCGHLVLLVTCMKSHRNTGTAQLFSSLRCYASVLSCAPGYGVTLGRV